MAALFLLARILIAAALVFLMPIALSLVGLLALSCLKRLRNHIRARLQTSIARRGLSDKHHKLVEAICDHAGDKVTWAIIALIAMLQCLATVNMANTKSAGGQLFDLALIYFGGLSMTLVVFRRTSMLEKLTTSPQSKLLGLALIAVLAWWGRYVTMSQLGWWYGGAAPHLTSAIAIGTLLRGAGVLCFGLAVVTALFEIAFYVVAFDTRKRENNEAVWRYRRAIATILTVFTFTFFSLHAAMPIAFGDQPVAVVLGDIAFDADMLPERACTGVQDSDRHIIFRNDELTQALVFTAPGVVDKAVRKWQANDYQVRMVRLTAVDPDCPIVTSHGSSQSGN
jgi:hypothetical protein